MHEILGVAIARHAAMLDTVCFIGGGRINAKVGEQVIQLRFIWQPRRLLKIMWCDRYDQLAVLPADCDRAVPVDIRPDTRVNHFLHFDSVCLKHKYLHFCGWEGAVLQCPFEHLIISFQFLTVDIFSAQPHRFELVTKDSFRRIQL